MVSAYIGGYVKNAPLLVGDRVKKGQLLLSLENIEFLQLQQDFLEASEQLHYLKSEYLRQEELFNEKIASKKTFLKAQSEYKKTLAIYKALKEKLKLLNIDSQAVEKGQLSSVANIYAPISGDITEVNINTGAYIDPADHIMSIVNTDHIHLELTVFERDAMLIKKGQPVYFRLPESSSRLFEGEIHLIGRSIDNNRRIKVHAHIKDEAVYRFIPGMFVQADIVVDQDLSFALPEPAIIDYNNRHYALKFVASSNDHYTFEKVELEIGRSYNGAVQILNSNSLDVDSNYLINGFNLLLEKEGHGH